MRDNEKIFTRAIPSLRERNDTVFLKVETKAQKKFPFFFSFFFFKLRGLLHRNLRDSWTLPEQWCLYRACARSPAALTAVSVQPSVSV